MQFDDVLIQLGQFGKYQKRQYFMICFPAIFCAIHQLASVFLSATPEYRCELPKSVYNATEDQFVILNDVHNQTVVDYIPLGNGGEKYEKCKLYDSAFTLANVTEPGVYECEGPYVYSKELFDSSIITKWNLLCDESWRATLSTSIYMAGVLVGSFAFGILSDGVGRKKTLLVCILIQGVSGVAVGFSPEYYSFVIFRFIVGAASMGVFMTCFVLGIELIGPKYRLVGGIVIEYFFALGYIVLTGVAYFSRNWMYTQIALSVPSFFFLPYYWFLSESPRWLLAKGRSADAEAIMQKAAKVNGVMLPKKLLDSLEESTTPEKVTALCTAKTLLCRTLIIFFNWFVIAMTYYGLSLNSGSIGGNIYVNLLVSGLVEFPAYTVCFACHKLGRKWPHVVGMLVGGLACFGTVLVDQFGRSENPTNAERDRLNIYFVVLNNVGKFGVTMGFAIIYFWSAEIYPTPLRNSLMGMSSTLARVGSILAPVISDIGNFVPKNYKTMLPAIIFGTLAAIAGLMSIGLPETTGHELPETIEEANLFPRRPEPRSDVISSESEQVTETKFG